MTCQRCFPVVSQTEAPHGAMRPRSVTCEVWCALPWTGWPNGTCRLQDRRLCWPCECECIGSSQHRPLAVKAARHREELEDELPADQRRCSRISACPHGPLDTRVAPSSSTGSSDEPLRSQACPSSQPPFRGWWILSREMDLNPSRLWQPTRSPKKENFRFSEHHECGRSRALPETVVASRFPETDCARERGAQCPAMSAHAKQGSEIHLPDPGRRGARARERLRRYRSGRQRIDYYPDERAARAIAALQTPYLGGDASSVINRVIAEWAAHRPDPPGAKPPAQR
jgi:hypothetical protein